MTPTPPQTAEDLPALPCLAPWRLALSECLLWPVACLDELPTSLLVAARAATDPADFVAAVLAHAPPDAEATAGLDTGHLVARVAAIFEAGIFA